MQRKEPKSEDLYLIYYFNFNKKGGGSAAHNSLTLVIYLLF